MPVAEQKLPDGWRLEASEDEQQSWLCLTGPGGQGCAFACDRGSVRAEVLQNLMVDMIAAGAALPAEPSMRERIAAALECLEDNDNHGATVILKTALAAGVKVSKEGQQHE